MPALRVLCWPGMPAAEALAEAGRRIGAEVHAEAVASNERLEARMGEAAWDVVFPSDYLVERLVARGELAELDAPESILAAFTAWTCDGAHDPSCTHSLPFAFGTTGYLCADGWGDGTWRALLEPAPEERVGMLDEVREVVGAALIAGGRSPNDASDVALGDAAARLLRQRPSVARYDASEFIAPVLRGEVVAHHAWSGQAAAAVRTHPGLRYVVPREGAILWLTTGAIPAAAPQPDAARALLLALCDPELAALTTRTEAYATPIEPARARLPEALREDESLFPPDAVLWRCGTLRDLGEEEAAMERVLAAVVAAGA